MTEKPTVKIEVEPVKAELKALGAGDRDDRAVIEMTAFEGNRRLLLSHSSKAI